MERSNVIVEKDGKRYGCWIYLPGIYRCGNCLRGHIKPKLKEWKKCRMCGSTLLTTGGAELKKGL